MPCTQEVSLWPSRECPPSKNTQWYPHTSCTGWQMCCKDWCPQNSPRTISPEYSCRSHQHSWIHLHLSVDLISNSRILSWTTSATLHVFFRLSVLIPSTRLSRGSGDSTFGNLSRRFTFYPLNAKNWMRCTSLATWCVLLYWWVIRFQKLPRFPGIHHFSNGISTLQGITADEQSIILYVSPITMHWIIADIT